MMGGDLIVAIDDHEVQDTADVSTIMEKHQPGDQITVTFYRGKKKMTARLTLTEGREVNT